MSDGPMGAAAADASVGGSLRASAVSDNTGSSKKYHLLMELGRGGSGIVHAAIARGIGGFSKLVVLKTTKPEFDSHEETVRLFLNEARLSSRMNHPNVVQVYEVYQEGGLPVIVMEYLEGQPLSKLLSRAIGDAACSTEIVLTILCNVLDALSYAHSLSDFGGRALGIVHRDVTPQNVMVTYDGQVKLLDFGIAKLNLQSSDTQTGIIKGKLGYMSPEQVSGVRLDARADVFAVGVILWEALAGRRMWLNHGAADIIRELLCERMPSLRAVVPQLDPELERICMRAVAPSVEDRYESAKALQADLLQFLAARGGLVSAASIAALLERTCADLRAKAQGRLELELAKFSRSTDENWQDGADEAFAASLSSEQRIQDARADPPRQLHAHEANTGTEQRPVVPEARVSLERQPARRRWPVLGLAAAALLGGSAWGLARWQGWLGAGEGLGALSAAPAVLEPATPVELPPQPATASSAAPGPAQSSDVNQQAAPVPPKAVAPASTVAPAKAGRRRAKVARDQGARSSVKLEPAPVAITAAAPGCDPPYYFDDKGIKHYRRECLKD